MYKFGGSLNTTMEPGLKYNFIELLDEIVPQEDMEPRKSKVREPPAFIIRPYHFSMGSIQGPLFRDEFGVGVDHSIVNLNFSEQTLFFRIPFDDAPFDWPVLQATSSIDDLQSMRLFKESQNTARLTMTLRRPPRLEADFRRMQEPIEGLSIRRATEIDWSPDHVEEGRSGAPATLPHGWRVFTPMKFGLWLTYSFQFSCRPSELKRVTVALSRLRTLDRPGTEEIAVDPDALPDTILPLPRGPNPYIGTDLCNVDKVLTDAKYAFDARYLVVGLVSQGLVLPSEVPTVADLLHHLWFDPPITRVAILRALFRLERSALVGTGARKQIHDLKRYMPAPRTRELSLPADRVSMRRAVVTPTRVLLFPEVIYFLLCIHGYSPRFCVLKEIETSNRVLRAWPAEMRAGRFIRVGFADEDGRLRITKRIVDAEDVDPEGGILARIANVLRHGVYIAGRQYTFLAAGESQLKDHSCWMVCEMGDFTADRVRQQMGDFSGEHVVAKYAARMGLCFSATRHVIDLVKQDIETLPDIKHGTHNYTDGVGNCSQELATMCARTLRSDQKTPSAVQIRMGGWKGVLCVHPHLEGNQVCLRDSMKKFQSPLMGLGVMKVSRFAPAHLNRQAICIMSALGMNTHALLGRFTQQIHHAQNLELELQALDTSRHPAKHIYKNAFIPVTKMIKAGLVDQQLLKNVLKCIKCQLLRDLKYKARVMVADGAYLMGMHNLSVTYLLTVQPGVADEYEILEEGQIYCAVTPTGANSRQVITGQCTIFRSPCIHPGDARLVTAVDHPVFQELPLTNVIVFSTKKAPRDLPSMGLRADFTADNFAGLVTVYEALSIVAPSHALCLGDFYTVVYDKELQVTRVHAPMDYSPVKPIQKAKVEIADIRGFVVDFIRSDILGLVASDHMALADRFGPEHPDCLELAKLHSDAVDFPKSGVPVHLPPHLRPVRYPDFMGRDPDVSYPSARVLGMMYRMIEPAPEYQPSSEISIDTRLTSRLVSLKYLKEAGIMKENVGFGSFTSYYRLTVRLTDYYAKYQPSQRSWLSELNAPPPITTAARGFLVQTAHH
ncbi:RNA dependent RNA polymerase-domain-containing protein [Mycena galopus ATCC 62051]|nr:RNA dependent RNA polymerase-domain-containing protein [Mycena galopus ATCC 62051]